MSETKTEPKFSCLMPTYNRLSDKRGAVFLEEAIESFLRQDYPNKELIVINDTPGQILELDERYLGVTIVNLPSRCSTLGLKLNVAALASTGDYLVRWDDDDIQFPHRLSLTAQHIGEADYWKTSHGFWEHAGGVEFPAGFFASCCIKRDAFIEVGGYTHMNSGEDQDIERKLHEANKRMEIFQVTEQTAFYLYRWNTGLPHLSAYPVGDGYVTMGRIPILSMTKVLRPHWREEYHKTIPTRFISKGALWPTSKSPSPVPQAT